MLFIYYFVVPFVMMSAFYQLSFLLHRYIRTIEELQRVEIDDLSREEKLAFFINLYNMMAIHALVTCGVPAGPLDRRKFFGDFKYVIGGRAYSLSAIQNGILRGNQRPPYNIAKPFGQKDQRSKVNKSDPIIPVKKLNIFLCSQLLAFSSNAPLMP